MSARDWFKAFFGGVIGFVLLIGISWAYEFIRMLMGE